MNTMQGSGGMRFAVKCLVMAMFLLPGGGTLWSASFPLDTFAFDHPMTVIDRAELAVIKGRIAASTQPQKTAYAGLLSDATAALGFTPDPPSTMEIMGGYETDSNLSEMRAWLWRNCHAAYSCALAYAYGGDTRYADKAVQVLMAWANKNTTFTGMDRGLQLGSFFSPMLYAADLIYDYSGWSAADKETFTQWWRNNVLVHTLLVLRTTTNNWKDAGLLGVMAAAVVLEDKELLEEGLEAMAGYFDGTWKIKKDSRGVYLPEEVVRNDGASGITYTAYALTTMTQAFEIARYAGFNLWHEVTSEGAGLQDVIEWYFKWNVLEETFPWNSDPGTTTSRSNSYELADFHFDVDSQLSSWLAGSRPVNGEQGDEYTTLNKGGMECAPVIDTIPPSVAQVTGIGNAAVRVVFSELVDEATAQSTSHYAVSGGITVLAAELASDGYAVTLTTSTLSTDVTYTLTVSGIKDRAATPNTMGTVQKTFVWTGCLGSSTS